jgi:GNAT superfamily N-acetyltransferase
MRIRAAQRADANAIAALHAASWRAAYRGAFSERYLAAEVDADRSSVWSERLERPPRNQRVLLAEERGSLAGFACAYLESDPQWGSLLDNMHVAEALQGRGVGGQLMRALACECVAAGGGLFLWVIKSNAPAQRFYEHLGGQRCGEDLWSPPGGGALPRYRYAWPDVRLLLRGG